MPVVFRCFYCRGKLSIARRKAGQDVECPRCQAIITVPTPDDLGRELTQLLSSANHRPVAAAPAAHAPATAPAYHFDDPDFDLPLPPPPTPAAPPPRLAKRPVPPRPARPPDDRPLFEAEGIEQLLESKIGPERPPDPPPPAPVAADLPSAVADDAFVVSRAKATLLLIAAVLATGLAFAAGFYVRGLS